jgi:hypothetical protein
VRLTDVHMHVVFVGGKAFCSAVTSVQEGRVCPQRFDRVELIIAFFSFVTRCCKDGGWCVVCMGPLERVACVALRAVALCASLCLTRPH